jgi:hypothetical protein
LLLLFLSHLFLPPSSSFYPHVILFLFFPSLQFIRSS